MSEVSFKKESYRGAVSITPSNTVDLVDPVSALYIGGTGNVKVDMFSGETVTFASVAAGVFKVAVKRVYSTGTTATSIIGLK